MTAETITALEQDVRRCAEGLLGAVTGLKEREKSVAEREAGLREAEAKYQQLMDRTVVQDRTSRQNATTIEGQNATITRLDRGRRC